MKNSISVKEYVKLICEKATDRSIITQIEDWKTKQFPSLFDNTTWYDVTKDYLKKYLTKFGRTEVIEYLYRNK